MSEERKEASLPDREPAEGGDDQVQAPGADKGDADGTDDKNRRWAGSGRREKPKDDEKEHEGDYDV